MAGVPQHQTIIIGAGFSGIGAGVLLDRAGFRDFVILEEGDGVGGAWHWNTYPGVAVDIPSLSYQFSFAQRSDWSRLYAPGAELKAYAEDLVATYDLGRRIRLGTKVTGMSWDEDAHLWSVHTGSGATLTARYVIGATGVLTQPKPPAIDGIEDFQGHVLHTARWNHDLDLAGKRVAIIGTGASAVQVIPSIAPHVADLTVFQRTPIWVFPKPDRALPRPVRGAFKVGGVRRVARLLSQSFVESSFPFMAHFSGAVPFVQAGAERFGRSYLRHAVKDPAVRNQLTPRYGLGCKRPSFSNDYLPAFNRDNVHLETTPITSITATGVRTSDGTCHEVDVLILATGFKVFETGNMPPFPIRGVAGLDLDTWWDQNTFKAFQGVSVPEFPNFFTILGPYAYNGSSYFNLIEVQMAHIVRCLEHARATAATRIEVTPDALDTFMDGMLARRKNQVFYNGTCTTANSYYFDKHGNVPFRPSTTLETMWTSRRFALNSYTFDKAA